MCVLMCIGLLGQLRVMPAGVRPASDDVDLQISALTGDMFLPKSRALSYLRTTKNKLTT